MGTWKGKAALSEDGDWTHGPRLRLKFNSHSESKAKVSDQEVKTIGEAYSAALRMTELAVKYLGDLRGGKDASLGSFLGEQRTLSQLVKEYFGTEHELGVIESTLSETMRGLRDNSRENRLYLFTGESKASEQVNPLSKGYVAHYDQGAKGKKNRPFRRPTPGTTHRSARPRCVARATSISSWQMSGQDAPGEVACTIIHEATHLFAGTAGWASARAR